MHFDIAHIKNEGTDDRNKYENVKCSHAVKGRPDFLLMHLASSRPNSRVRQSVIQLM